MTKSKTKTRTPSSHRKNIRTALGLFTAALLVLAAGWALANGTASQETAPASGSGTAFTGDRAETLAFMKDYAEIQLTPEQEAIRVEALESLPAPCCAKFSAATCCCECNMARATWGLAKRLIAIEGYGADRVRSTVSEWHRAINPDGFSGEACFEGGCSRAFDHDGCGGMRADNLVS